ncbi:conserved hypothetical protein [Azorhizobium caulinodans ORS 571]|uniref:Major facilitator superfamily (MFS) profile domain-containing protein n=1 Tax=Azorhizobium caulinodans (strain ATCC 43989 / DSM 5975 / JCM 20966 / LMG 6465 / NBRC 14845 / NCIMB 13405 / ORS 571) TaxID=438753 RepID=A8IBN6_AZOC5|nr:MFS transporter [Azorhizobium caulinodans]BAF89095.1 conserved hypothetical protein [Azorhizobium caulinodans ORS 571]
MTRRSAADPTAAELVARYDGQAMGPRYWTTFAVLAGVATLDFADFFLIGFILAVIGPEWGLSYGQSAMILYGGGVGSILAALLWGSVSDARGRKRQIISGTIICGLSAGLIAFVPQGWWELIVALRILVGFGLAASATPVLTLVVEVTPTRHRTRVGSLFMVFSSLGILVAALSSGLLIETLGWRGVALLGFMPLVPALLTALFVPESLRWLVAVGRISQAMALVGEPGQAGAAAPQVEKGRGLIRSLGDLYERPRIFWQVVIVNAAALTVVFGYYLWGPTIMSAELGRSVGGTALYFVIISGCGILGRLSTAVVVPFTGRRPLGIVLALLAAVALACVSLSGGRTVAGVPMALISLSCAAFFCEGGLANSAPYAIEQYGARLGARAAGLAQAASGVGRIIGPLALALIAGSSNVVSPAFSAAAAAPAFLFFAGCMVLVSGAFVFLAVETNGRPID